MKKRLGSGWESGAPDHRAYVGPPEDYDLIAALAFSLLASLGMRADHSLTDVGCGSLRIGRLLIPYLNEGRYTGIEPNRWLVKAGIRQEMGRDLMRIKRPRFVYGGSATGIDTGSQNWVLAQSIFSHCGIDLLRTWLAEIARITAPGGSLVATFVESENDRAEGNWHYPECTEFTWKTINHECAQIGMVAEKLDWQHPRQKWFISRRYA